MHSGFSGSGGSSSSARLDRAWERLWSSLSLPRLNRSKVQELVETVQEAQAEALAGAAAALAAAQKDVELVAAQKDVALVTAQMDVALVAAQKDAVLMEALKTVAMFGLQVEVFELQIKELVADNLRLRGMLDARGLMEYAEERLFSQLDPATKLDRESKWAQLGGRHPALEAAILQANPQWKARWIPDKAVQLYSHLSSLMHRGALPAAVSNKVVLAEGPLSREQMRFLECVAAAVHCPVQLCYLLQQPATRNSRSAPGI
ncbi:DNA gyrase subunit A [Chlorella sorokiniana]|uniref:DNA gyrase subunit A n=1 Tax=Chlorella sorokiniana TaxID=3076 RepID=A0A2P6TLQ5_CHLSO|nr:DNA gyrase subunit A [Chlorella sorokiniana]|eukprot:PRW45218.1 DNA gyrase subunit A [Chlorella sorokiniana]